MSGLSKDLAPPVRVAIVEDNRGYRESLETILRGAPGFLLVSVSANAQHALQQIPAVQADVALIDLQLAEGKPGGIDVIRQLKGRFPNLGLLVLTNFGNADRIFGAIKAGATGYVLKRTPPAQILEAIVQVHEGGSPMTPHIARMVLNYIHTLEPQSEAEQTQKLTAREEEVLRLAQQGRTYKEIATALAIKYDTVRTHFNNIYQKLHVHSRAEAVMKCAWQAH